jgi:hypothetical protein
MASPKPLGNVRRRQFLTGAMVSQRVPAQRSSCQGMFGGTSATSYKIALQLKHMRAT